MKLTPEQIALAQTKLHATSKEVCPMCGKDGLKLLPQMSQLLSPEEESPGKFFIDGTIPYMPCLVAICPNCSHLMLYNAVTMGLVKGPG